MTRAAPPDSELPDGNSVPPADLVGAEVASIQSANSLDIWTLRSIALRRIRSLP